MFARRKLAKRFSLLLLEDEENYVADWAASCKWPSSVEGNWQGLAALPGRLRLCTKSLFFEPDDVRVPIVRCAARDGGHNCRGVALNNIWDVDVVASRLISRQVQ
jgi:factor associated with neutral sphingomyelinase activation